jgi:arginine exporter protein ArgO
MMSYAEIMFYFGLFCLIGMGMAVFMHEWDARAYKNVKKRQKELRQRYRNE